MKDLEDYAEETASSLLYLTLEAMNVRSTHADHAASHLGPRYVLNLPSGKALGLVTLLRGLPHHLRAGEIYLPQDLTLKVLFS